MSRHTTFLLGLALLAMALTARASYDARATHFGSADNDSVYELLVHPLNGDVYLVGSIQQDIPATAGAWITQRQGLACGTAPSHICVGMLARFSTDLGTLVAATYLPGSSAGRWTALVVDPISGDLFLAGEGGGLGGTAGAHQAAPGGNLDGMIVRLRADLSGPPLAATNYGNIGFESIHSLALSPVNGDLYALGSTTNASAPGVAGGAQSVHGGGVDALVLRFSPDLTTLRQASFLGGSGSDWGAANDKAWRGIAVHPTSGDVYVVNSTASQDFPTTAGALQPDWPGTAVNGYVTRFHADLTAILASTYIGGPSWTWAVTAAAFDPLTDALYVVGKAGPGNTLPGTAGGAQPSFPAGAVEAGFVAQIAADLGSVTKATYYAPLNAPGPSVPYLADLAIDAASGEVYVLGWAQPGVLLPAGAGGLVETSATFATPFLARLDESLGAILQSSFVGSGGTPLNARALGFDPMGTHVYAAFDRFGAGSYTFSDDGAFPGNPGGTSAVLTGLHRQLSVGLFADGFESP
jgi:hypothetical protein